jgi:cellulose biosynthesis protein BcsQ
MPDYDLQAVGQAVIRPGGSGARIRHPADNEAGDMLKTPLVTDAKKLELKTFIAPRHPGAICVANYKGGVGKTTLVCLLGYFLAERTKKKVLMFDIDPQCSLSLAVGFNPDEVNKTELTVYNLVKPSKWTTVKKTNFDNYVVKVPEDLSPTGLYIVRGSFDVENLDLEIAKSMVGDSKRRLDELFLYCKQMLMAYEQYDYVLVDCPPNKMFLTQAMLRACSFYLPVTIPDAISIYGMPRLLRWVKQIPAGDRPKLLGYVLNAINRAGGTRGGKVYSQQSAAARLRRSIQGDLDDVETAVIGEAPLIGEIPRLDVIARFLGEEDAKFSRYEFSRRTSGQPTVQDCLRVITDEILRRIGAYRAKTGNQP